MLASLRSAQGPRVSATVAERLAAGVEPFVGGELPVRLRAWDGSETGPVDAPRVVINSPDALKRLIWRPGELGAAQAYEVSSAAMYSAG